MLDIRENYLGFGARREKRVAGALEPRLITIKEEQYLPNIVHQQIGLQNIQVSAEDRVGSKVHIVWSTEESP